MSCREKNRGGTNSLTPILRNGADRATARVLYVVQQAAACTGGHFTEP